MSNATRSLATAFPLGLIPAVHTPIGSQGELNLRVVERQAEYLSSRGLTGVFVAGTTGECHSLTVQQRQQLVARWCEVARGTELRVFVHVGHNCQRDARELATHARDCGAAALAAMAPFYFKPETTVELIEFLSPIAAAAPQLPFFFYDIPAMTGVHLKMPQFLELGKRRIANLAGVKFTNPDLFAMQQCVQVSDGIFQVLHGFDETLLAGVTLGACGAVGNTYNIAASLYQRLLSSWAEGNLLAARDFQSQSVQLILTLQAFGFLAAAKAAMELVGVDCGPPLPPLQPLGEDSKRELFAQLKNLQIIESARA